MKPKPALLFPCLLTLLAITLVQPTVAQESAEFKLKEHADGIEVLHGDKVIANYLTKSFSKPIIWPLVGPTGAKMTRDYPMVKDSKDEAHDHPHHRSLWFTHGEVNDIDFWLEGEGKGGITEHVEFTEKKGGKSAVIGSRNLWKSPDGSKIVLSDKRRFTFGADSETNWVDCEVELIASEGDVHFGDTKEGTFGVRVAESMKVDAKKGGKIVNSAGLTDSKAWGQPAEWVDYYGPVGEETVGLAILSHPSTFRHPNRWHVRTYGLFAANPFGEYHFTGSKEKTDGVRLKKGDSLLFRYRVLMHAGDEKEGKIAERYAEAVVREATNALQVQHHSLPALPVDYVSIDLCRRHNGYQRGGSGLGCRTNTCNRFGGPHCRRLRLHWN